MLVLLFLVFRGVVAAITPLLVAAVAVAGALLILLGVSHVADISAYSVNVITMLGLGLAVDYSLLVISRYREERAGDLSELAAAIERTMATAGRTVAFSGLTVAASLCGLLAFAEPFLRSLAWGGIGVVLVALVAAVTLVPALLGSGAADVRPTRATQATTGLFASLSRLVQRRAVLIVVAAAVPLAVVAAPFLRAHYQQPDASFLPRRGRVPRAGRDPPGPLRPRGLGRAGGRAGRRRRRPGRPGRLRRPRSPAWTGVRAVAEPRGLGGGAHVLEVLPEGSGTDAAASRLVAGIRSLPAPFAVQVTGDAAALADYQATIRERLPLAAALIGLATFALLFLMTGSVVVPVKAIVMNVLSLGASFGALVWVFQEGHLSGPLGFDPPGMVDITVPVLIFVFAFGLSMDYEVFLLSRIKEAWDQTGDNDRAVALGLQRSGRIVTSAAALIVIVFLGFAAGELLTIKEVGLGMAIAVVLDATVVRMLLVPATIELIGRWNWSAPPAMRRLHDRFGLVEQRPPAPARPSDQEERVGSLHAGP